MTEHKNIKTLKGGSIDYGYYMNRGRIMRSASFLSTLGGLARAIASLRRTSLNSASARDGASVAPRIRQPSRGSNLGVTPAE